MTPEVVVLRMCFPPCPPPPLRVVCQVALFSATMPSEALDLTSKFMRDPAIILVKREELTLDGIKQVCVRVCLRLCACVLWLCSCACVCVCACVHVCICACDA